MTVFIYPLCSFPGATNDTLLAKFHAQHQNNLYYEVPQMRESAFSIVHYAGKVKYHIQVCSNENSSKSVQCTLQLLGRMCTGARFTKYS